MNLTDFNTRHKASSLRYEDYNLFKLDYIDCFQYSINLSYAIYINDETNLDVGFRHKYIIFFK